MRILHTEASCGWGGQEIRILEESSGLIGRGHSVTVACSVHARMSTEAARFGVPVVTLPIEAKTIGGFRALRQFLNTHPVDVVNTHSSVDSWLVALVCRSMRTPPSIVRTRHVSVPVSGSFANRWLYRQARMVATTGESLRQHLVNVLALDPDRVISVPTGIDTDRFCPLERTTAKIQLGLNPEHKHVGILATLRSWKGHLFLLEALAAIQRPDLRLLIVGEGPMLDPIREKISALALTERVILTGQRTDPERWLQAMDVFCLPSYANEGVPQAILQAMLCACPIVTTPVGAILEAVTDRKSALVVPPKNSPALASAIETLLGDQALAASLGSEARRIASTAFSRAGMLDQMEAIFTQAMQ